MVGRFVSFEKSTVTVDVQAQRHLVAEGWVGPMG